MLAPLEAPRELGPCTGQLIKVDGYAVQQPDTTKQLFIGHGERFSTVHYESAELNVIVTHCDDDYVELSVNADSTMQVWETATAFGLLISGKNDAGNHWAWIGDLGRSSLFAYGRDAQQINELVASLCAL